MPRTFSPEVDGAELDLLRHFPLPTEGAGVVVDDLDLAAGQLGHFIGELLRRLRGAVLGRVDVAQHKLACLGLDGRPRRRERRGQ